MTKTLAALCATAALALCASPALTQDAPGAALLPKNPRDAADMQCLALIFVIVGTDESMGDQLGLGAFYYLGRLEGRSPQIDWRETTNAYTETVDLDALFAERPRCGDELIAKGEEMIRFGSEKPD